jgi:glycogen phosphorylase
MQQLPQTPVDVASGSDPVRTGLTVASLKQAIRDNLYYIQGKFPAVATDHDYYMALAYTVRDRLLNRWLDTAQTYLSQASRTVCYLSAEFLLGPHLGMNLLNLGIEPQVRQAVSELGLDLATLLDQEEEPGLGNGGLGRLAACYLDSLSTLEIPAIGYGIRYEFGIFDQEIRHGWQVEITDKWLKMGNPWEIPRPQISFDVKYGGRTEAYTDAQGQYRVRWLPDRVVKGVAYDTPILGYRVHTANFLRLWKAEATESFDFQAFNLGNYYGAVQAKITSENITKVLYPNDEQLEGKKLRLEQQYFFVSCALQDMIRIYLQRSTDLSGFAQKFVAQLNDTHPAIAVAELMRLLVDEHGMAWTSAWQITQNTFAYTNHTLLPEALEKWPIALFASLLPRHLEIIYEINHRFLDQVSRNGTTTSEVLAQLTKLSLIEENGERYVRMAHLACVGSHHINGVARLHTELLKQTVLQDFYHYCPEKFVNVTNGISVRRWLVLSNPRLSELISRTIGEAWLRDLNQLQGLAAYAEDPSFVQTWHEVKQAIKQDFAVHIQAHTGVQVNPAALFDIQVKRFHEYKRQHLNVLHIITLYHRLRQNPDLPVTPRVFIFAGKAAPGYAMAKLIIKLINAVAEVINHDPVVGERLKVVFLPDFNVKNAQRIYPAADLSEQISLAGTEASGTGNMKFALNGALTIGTLDGANIEIQQAVGEENFFAFGLTAAQVFQLKSQGYHPQAYLEQQSELKAVIDLIGNGHFSQGDPHLFRPLLTSLLHTDPYLLFADYAAYLDAQQRVGKAFQDPAQWQKMSILNVAHMGRFSSDRAVQEYCDKIWQIQPVTIDENAIP